MNVQRRMSALQRALGGAAVRLQFDPRNEFRSWAVEAFVKLPSDTYSGPERYAKWHRLSEGDTAKQALATARSMVVRFLVATEPVDE